MRLAGNFLLGGSVDNRGAGSSARRPAAPPQDAVRHVFAVLAGTPRGAAGAQALETALEVLSALCAHESGAEAAVEQGAFEALASLRESCRFAGVAENVSLTAARIAQQHRGGGGECSCSHWHSGGGSPEHRASRPARLRRSGAGAGDQAPRGLRELAQVLFSALSDFSNVPSTVAAVAGALARLSSISPRGLTAPFVTTCSGAHARELTDLHSTRAQAELQLLFDLSSEPGASDTLALLVGTIAEHRTDILRDPRSAQAVCRAIRLLTCRASGLAGPAMLEMARGLSDCHAHDSLAFATHDASGPFAHCSHHACAAASCALRRCLCPRRSSESPRTPCPGDERCGASRTCRSHQTPLSLARASAKLARSARSSVQPRLNTPGSATPRAAPPAQSYFSRQARELPPSMLAGTITQAVELGAADGVFRVLKEHRDSAEVLEEALLALAVLCNAESNLETAVTVAALQRHVLPAMRQHAERPAVQRAACLLLATLACCGDAQAASIAARFSREVLEILRAFTKLAPLATARPRTPPQYLTSDEPPAALLRAAFARS